MATYNPLLENADMFKTAYDNLFLAKGIRTFQNDSYYRYILMYCNFSTQRVLQAYLFYKEVPYISVRDLTELLDLCVAVEEDLISLTDYVKVLAPYTIEVGYPGFPEPTREMADQSIDYAQRIYDTILSKIDESVTCKIASSKGLQNGTYEH